jgi:hypothetical protein
MEHESIVTRESQSHPGVRYRVKRMSFGRRIELLRQVRELAAKAEFLEASNDPREKIEATLLAGEIDRLYLLWGLVGIEGLEVDGQAATPELLVEAGPEALCREILAAVKAEAGLTQDEQKN